MIKHHLVQIAPVAVSARFCTSESFSAGLAKSLIPARTRAHYDSLKAAARTSIVIWTYLHNGGPGIGLAWIVNG